MQYLCSSVPLNIPHLRDFAATVKLYTHPNNIITTQTFTTFLVKRSDTLQDLAPRLSRPIVFERQLYINICCTQSLIN